ncbi:helicase-associated domain-containing protein [Brachybacterium hainanense]|uniref:Helicase-associated domain-containing protein n=1 Tax=Brachybacterium hainanense TaxID=1541174 RepID=A0ABV6RG22_9MICO
MPATPRSLADALRSFRDEQLQRLLAARGDLLVPLPQGLGPLAARAASGPSSQRALHRLDRPALQLVEALAVLPDQAPRSALARAVGATPGEIEETLSHLQDLALVWGGQELRLVRSLRDGLRHPAGLGPVLAEDPSPQEAETRVAAARGADDEVAGVLDALSFGPARLEVGDSALGPLLRERGIAVPAAEGVLRIPRSVHLALRGGRVHERFAAHPPTIAGVARPERFAGTRSAQAAEAALETLRITGIIGDLDRDPPGVLTRGGLPQRELRRLAEAADAPLPEVVTVLQTCWTAGLVGHDGLTWQPTRDWDEFRERSEEQRWAELALAWLRSEDLPSLVGTPDPRGGPAHAALSAATRRPGVRARRETLLALHAQLHEDSPDTAADGPALREALSWHHPLVPAPVLAQEADAFEREAATLGLVLAGVPTRLGLALDRARRRTDAAEVDALLVEALAAVLPPPVDEVLLDADLTVVVPGRPSRRLSALSAWTEPVSRGGALTLRFTPASVRRALDAGEDPAALRALLESASRTPVPQVLAVLLADEQRRHGRIAVMPAVTALSAEEEVLTIVLSHPEAALLDLRRLAPGVAVTMAGPAVVMRAIERTGLSGVAVGRDGTLTRPTALHRLPGSREDVDPGHGPELPLTPEEAVLRIRAADAGEAELPVADRLRDAIARETELRIGVVDGRGGIAVRRVLPLSLEGGRLRARDAGTGEEFTVLVHRVTLG